MSQSFSFTSYSSAGASQPLVPTQSADGAAKPEYTLSGILHYLQSEWRRYEHDRNSWAIERAELRARIALLEGERRGVEHIRTDLLRRIKMLEYALRQERNKGQGISTAPNGQSAQMSQGAAPTQPGFLCRPPTDRDSTQSEEPIPSTANMRLPPGVKDARARTKFREYLQQCLQEISYLTNPATLNPLPNNSAYPRPKLALEEEKPDHVGQIGAAIEPGAPSDTATQEPTTGKEPEPEPEPTCEVTAEVPAPRRVPDVQLWETKGIIRAHFDMVRATAFDTVHAGLFSASDDCTIKYWDVPMLAAAHQPASTEMNAENTLMLRGHTKPVTSLAYSRTRDQLFSGSIDATVRCWKLPTRPREKYAPVPPTEGPVLAAGGAVWSVALLNGDSILASASTDGLVRLWNLDDASMIRSWGFNGPDSTDNDPVPTSVTACPPNERIVAVAYSNAIVKIFSIDDGHEVRTIRADATYDGTSTTQINMVVAHPTLPLLATAHEDNYIHMFDMDTGEKVMSLHAHASSVSSIAFDPAGLTLMSGSHDGTVRFWDIVEHRAGKAQSANTQGAVCFQEISAHETRANEGVLEVAYHPNAPYVSTAGADGHVRILG